MIQFSCVPVILVGIFRRFHFVFVQVTPDPTDLMEVAHPGGEELYKLYSRLLREVLRSQKCTLAPPPPPMPPI